MTEPFNLAGFALEGAQAQLGKLLSDAIKYQFAFEQLRKLHAPSRGQTSNYPCSCGEFKCSTFAILNTLENSLK